jgi:hypothetical protein
MNPEFIKYNKTQLSPFREVCDLLLKLLSENLPESESKIWHRHPVWVIDGNPVAGYRNNFNGPSIRIINLHLFIQRRVSEF